MRIDGWAFLGLVACQGRDRRSGGGGIGASRIGSNVLWSVSGRIARRFFVLSRSSRGGFGSGFAILVWVAWAGLGWVRVSVVESGGWRDGVGIWEFAPALVCVEVCSRLFFSLSEFGYLRAWTVESWVGGWSLFFFWLTARFAILCTYRAKDDDHFFFFLWVVVGCYRGSTIWEELSVFQVVLFLNATLGLCFCLLPNAAHG